VVSRHGEHGRLEGAQDTGGALVLVAPAAIREVARRDDQLGTHPADESRERVGDVRILTCTDMEIGHMEEACRHDRMRL
jgi:hypothetical protein